MIGADAAMNVSAANISTGGILNALIDNSGGTIGGSANLAFNLSGQLATQSDTSFTINNSNGGMIGVDAGMNVSAASISTVGSLFANILNFASGNIVGGADLTLNLDRRSYHAGRCDCLRSRTTPAERSGRMP